MWCRKERGTQVTVVDAAAVQARQQLDWAVQALVGRTLQQSLLEVKCAVHFGIHTVRF